MVAVPLQAQLTDGQGSTLVVTAALLDELAFSSSIPGGFRDAGLALAQKLTAYDSRLDAFAKLRVIDSRNGRVVWQGRLDVPSRESGGQGEVSKLTAAGSAAHAKDNSKPVLYVDSGMGNWVPGLLTSSTFQVQKLDNAAPGSVGGRIQYAFPRGATVVASSNMSLRHYGLQQTGQKVARLNHTAASGGSTSSSFEIRLAGRPGSGIPGETGIYLAWLTRTLSTTVAALGVRLGSGITGNYYIPEVQAVYTGGTAVVGDDLAYFLTTNPVLRGSCFDASGAEILSGYLTDTIAQRDVVIDSLTRFCPQYDLATATISSAATTAFDQLCYLDGVVAADLWDDLMLVDPAFYWAAWEDTANAKSRFEWSTYPTQISYSVDARDSGFQSPGSAGDLYDSVQVRWKDDRGIQRTTTVTGSSSILTQAGVSRQARLDLGSEVGSAAQAAAAGNAFLVSRSLPVNNGTVKISEPIYDLLQRRMVMPWELLPGKLISVRNVRPRLDALNPTRGDAVSTFIVTETSYSAKANVATLTLDSYTSTVAKALARIVGRQRRLVRS